MMTGTKLALTVLIGLTVLGGDRHQVANATQGTMLADETLDHFLERGQWSPAADDTIHGERLDSAFVRSLVENYRASPTDPKAINGLGLLVLAEAVAGWGMESEPNLPPDPADQSWNGPSKVQLGKHLMSYAKGGIGIPHADSSFLTQLFAYLRANHTGLADQADQFFKLEGIRYDPLYANGGHCNQPTTVLQHDLAGVKFAHGKFGHGGTHYCNTYQPKADTNEEDWRVFRHWMRAALQQRDVQQWIIEHWLARYWIPSYNQLVKDQGRSIEEAFVNARIRNSSSKTATCAIEHAADAADPVAAQLEAYTVRICGGKESHERRFGVMRRPIVLYRHFSHEQ